MSFESKHGYKEGTYEGKLNDAGIPESEWGDYGSNVNPNEFNKISDAWNAKTVVAATTGAVEKPQDLASIRSDINDEHGVGAAQIAVDEGKAGLREHDTGTSAGLIDIEGGTGSQVSMSKIVGRQGRFSQLRSTERRSLADVLQADVDIYTAKSAAANEAYRLAENERNLITNLITSNPGAGITYQDTPETAAQKINTYNKNEETRLRKQAESDQSKADKKAEKAAKKQYKTDLKSTLRSLGISTKNSKGGSLSTSGLEKLLEKHSAEELAYVRRERDASLASTNRANQPNSETEGDNIDSFYSDAGSLRKGMFNGEGNWAYAWNQLRTKYPEASVELIDQTLGLDARDAFDN